MQPPEAAIRQAYPRVLAGLVRRLGSVHDAEDALHTAVVRALETWPRAGVPDHPDRWLLITASNKAIDAFRASTRRQRLVSTIDDFLETATPPAVNLEGWPDDGLRLLATCCDPVLGLDERVALTLATIGGLSTREIAGLFLVQPGTMEKRLVRARSRLRARATGATPAFASLKERLDGMLAVIHLLHGEGAWSSSEEAVEYDLLRFAHRLAVALSEALPREPEAQALLAILEFHRGRLPARVAGGRFLTLEEQDRGLWDRMALDSGRSLLSTALTMKRPGPYQLEAAISAVHCAAESAEETDWPQIALLYEQLERLRPSPVVTINRAFALGMAAGPSVGLALLEQVSSEDVPGSPYIHLVRGTLLAQTGRAEQALESLREAVASARNPIEKEQIERRMAAVRERPSKRQESLE